MDNVVAFLETHMKDNGFIRRVDEHTLMLYDLLSWTPVMQTTIQRMCPGCDITWDVSDNSVSGFTVTIKEKKTGIKCFFLQVFFLTIVCVNLHLLYCLKNSSK
jgi:hypothetical protein